MYLYTTILLLICCIVIIIKTQVDKKNVEKIQHKRQVLQELEQDLIVKENASLTIVANNKLNKIELTNSKSKIILDWVWIYVDSISCATFAKLGTSSVPAPGSYFSPSM